MEIARSLFQIVMAQQNLDGVQVRTRFQHVRGKAVTEHVGVHLLLKAGTTSSVLAGVPSLQKKCHTQVELPDLGGVKVEATRQISPVVVEETVLALLWGRKSAAYRVFSTT